jgi:hypothetical protein
MYNWTTRQDDFFASAEWKTAGELLGISRRSRKNTVNTRECAIAHTGQTGAEEPSSLCTPDSK